MNPSDSNARSEQAFLDLCALRNDGSHDLMSEGDWKAWWCCPAFDFVELRVADPTAAHFEHHVMGRYEPYGFEGRQR